MKKFTELNLPPALLRATEQLGYNELTQIQAEALPLLLHGHDVVAQAKTGSGKTAAFALALLAKLNLDCAQVQGLILCPTRELSEQICKEIRALACFIPNVKVVSLCGGIPLRPQIAALEFAPHIVVGTPGRIQELLDKKHLNLDHVHTLILDEADRMLDMGFIADISAIVARLPAARQTSLFSASYTELVRQLSQQFQRQAINISLAENHADTVIAQQFYAVEATEKFSTLLSLLGAKQPANCLVFCNTKQDTKAVAKQLQDRGVSALELHGDLEQRDRDEALLQFANGSCRVLVATDVAARGLDIKSLAMVIAYELPHEAETYLHRMGRTGRAGETGVMISLVANAEKPRLENMAEWTPAPIIWQKPSASKFSRLFLGAEMKTLVIDAGRQDKLRAGDLLGALTGAAGLAADAVGKIDIFATRSYVAIQKNSFAAALEKLRANKIKGRNFRVREL